MDAMQHGLGALLTLLLLAGALWWLRSKGLAQFAVKLPGGGKGRRMKTIERLSLTPQHSLHLVEVGGRRLLIAASPGGCSILDGIASGSDRTAVE
jgi:flagellar biogenesis protein FliO